MKANRRFAFLAAWREMSPFCAKFAMPAEGLFDYDYDYEGASPNVLTTSPSPAPQILHRGHQKAFSIWDKLTPKTDFASLSSSCSGPEK